MARWFFVIVVESAGVVGPMELAGLRFRACYCLAVALIALSAWGIEIMIDAGFTAEWAMKLRAGLLVTNSIE